MNLLIYSHFFAPSVGGVETIVQSLAAGIAELRTLNGDREFNVTVVTETAADGYDEGNAVSLANCLRRVIENPALIDAYGERARSRALQVFQRSEMLAGHARIYRGGH
jgi:hypothetical protein